MDLSVLDSIKLGRALVALGGMSCGGTGCLSCRGKQSTSSSLLLSGLSLLLLLLCFGPNPWYADYFVSVFFGVDLRGACVGLCVYAGIENEYHGCSCGGVFCCNAGCLSCQGKQSASLSLSSLGQTLTKETITLPIYTICIALLSS